MYAKYFQWNPGGTKKEEFLLPAWRALNRLTMFAVLVSGNKKHALYGGTRRVGGILDYMIRFIDAAG